MSPTAGEVSLTRQGATAGTLRVNLRWKPRGDSGTQERSNRRGLLPRRAEPMMSDPNHPVDLDLGCLYQFTDGQRGVVQAVGKRSGDYARPPYIRLDRDDRIGSSTGENIFVNMDHNAHFQRILIFVMVASGTRSLTSVGAVVTIYPTAGPALEIRLDPGQNVPAHPNSCAVAQIRRQGTDIVVKREVQYFAGYQSEIDTAFNWGLHWGQGPGKVRR
jgi:tellurite resistance protein TerA